MEDFVTTNIGVYGPVAVFVLLMLSGIGIPLNEDLVIIPAGILVGNGELPLWPTVMAAYFGVAGSDCLWFTMCYRYGAFLVHRRWFKRLIHPRRLLEAKHQVEVRGVWVVVMARFIPASRTPTITIAGMLHLPPWQFVLATVTCVLISAPLQLSLGYVIALGLRSQQFADQVLYIIGGVMLVVLVVLVIRWWMQHQPTVKRLPRARAAWLRSFRVRRIVSKLHKREHAQD